MLTSDTNNLAQNAKGNRMIKAQMRKRTEETNIIIKPFTNCIATAAGLRGYGANNFLLWAIDREAGNNSNQEFVSVVQNRNFCE